MHLSRGLYLRRMALCQSQIHILIMGTMVVAATTRQALKLNLKIGSPSHSLSGPDEMLTVLTLGQPLTDYRLPE